MHKAKEILITQGTYLIEIIAIILGWIISISLSTEVDVHRSEFLYDILDI